MDKKKNTKSSNREKPENKKQEASKRKEALTLIMLKIRLIQILIQKFNLRLRKKLA